jgi:hypothetical protein
VLVHEDHHQTIRQLAGTIGISYGVGKKIITKNVNKRHIPVKFVSLLFDKRSKAAVCKTCVLSYKRMLTRTQFVSLRSQIENETEGTFWNNVHHHKH